MSAVPFDWVRECGMLRGELLALEVFLQSGAPREHLLQQVQKGLRESKQRLDDHYGPLSNAGAPMVPLHASAFTAPRVATGD